MTEKEKTSLPTRGACSNTLCGAASYIFLRLQFCFILSQLYFPFVLISLSNHLFFVSFLSSNMIMAVPNCFLTVNSISQRRLSFNNNSHTLQSFNRLDHISNNKSSCSALSINTICWRKRSFVRASLTGSSDQLDGEPSLVASFGEMLIDVVPTVGGLSLAEAPAFKKAPGGAPANVAIAIARLGGSSAFIGKVFADPALMHNSSIFFSIRCSIHIYGHAH